MSLCEANNLCERVCHLLQTLFETHNQHSSAGHILEQRYSKIFTEVELSRGRCTWIFLPSMNNTSPDIFRIVRKC